MRYVVYHPHRGYLRLDGPFCYPVWHYGIDLATDLTFVQAHAYAQAYGGEVKSR